MNTARLDIAIEVDDRGTVKIRQLEKVARDAGETTERSFKRAGRSLGDFNNQAGTSLGSIKALYGAIASTAAVAALVSVSRASLQAASDLEEVSSKFDVVFKGQEALAEAWAQTLVQSYGLSTRASKQYLSSMQDLLVPMGMSAEAAGRMSNEVVKLSVDIGSFNNLPTAQVMDDIQSALVDNYETMKKYGVVLNATVVQQKAMDMGLASTIKELTAADKAQAAYKLIVEGSSAAVGDHARTAGSYANQLKEMHNRLEDVRAAIGQGLLPVMTGLLNDFNSWYAVNGDLLNQDLKTWAEGIAGGIQKIITSGKEAAPVLDSIGTAAENTYDIASKLADVGGPSTMEWGLIGWVLLRGNPEAAALIAALTTINNSLGTFDLNLGSLHDKWKEYDRAMGDFVQSVKDWYAQSPKAQEFFGIYVNGAEKSTEATITLDQALSDLSSTFLASITDTDAEIQALEDFYTVTGKGGDAAQQAAKVACDAHKKQLTCAEQALKKEVDAAVAAGRKMKDFWQIQARDKYEVQSRALDAEIAAQKEADQAILSDLETMMGEQEAIYGFGAEQVTGIQEQMVNDLGRIFDGYINDVLHSQINSVGDLFKGLFDSIVDMFFRMLSQFAANSLVEAIFGQGTSGGMTLGGALSSLFGGSSGGGPISVGNVASLGNTVSGWFGGPSTSTITAPASSYVSGQVGLGSGTLGTNLATGAHAVYSAATTGVGTVGSWYAGLQAAGNGVNAGTQLALIEGTYGQLASETAAAVSEGVAAGVSQGVAEAATVDFSIDAAGGYAGSTAVGEGASMGIGTAAGYAGAAAVVASVAYGIFKNFSKDKRNPEEIAYSNLLEDMRDGRYYAGSDADSEGGYEPDGYLADLTEKFSVRIEGAFQHIATEVAYDFQGLTEQLSQSFNSASVEQYLESISHIDLSMEQATAAMQLAEEAAQGDSYAFEMLHNYFIGLGMSAEQAGAASVGLLEALNMQGQVTDETIGQIIGLTEAETALSGAMTTNGESVQSLINSYDGSRESLEYLIGELTGYEESVHSNAEMLQLATSAAQGNTGAVDALVSAFTDFGQSSSRAKGSTEAMIRAVQHLSNTNLDLEATARLNVEVQGAAHASAGISGGVSTSSSSFWANRASWYDDLGANYNGAIFMHPAVFRQGQSVAEMHKPEVVAPLHAGQDTLKIMHDDIKAAQGRPIVINLQNNIAGKKVQEVIIPVVDRHIDNRERAGVSGRVAYAAD